MNDVLYIGKKYKVCLLKLLRQKKLGRSVGKSCYFLNDFLVIEGLKGFFGP